MRPMSGAQAILPAQPSGSPSGQHHPGERSTGEAQRRGRVAEVLGLRDGALVAGAAVKAEVRDPRAAEGREEEVVGAGVAMVVAAVADHARTPGVGSQSGPTPGFFYFRSGGWCLRA